MPDDSPLVFAAIQAALKAGHLLRKGFGTKYLVSSKTSAQDLVTEYDHAAEEAIISSISQQFSDHAFLAEESGLSANNKNAPVLWIIDPLDGTMNFAHHIPVFVVSIAAFVDNHIEVGVIYQPLVDELFIAQRGRGAYLNGTRLQVSSTAQLSNAVVATGFPYGSNEVRNQCIDQFVNFLQIGSPVRIIGSAALNLAYIASGRFDAGWGTNLKPWDIAAGKLLLEEAGGKLTQSDGTAFDLFKNSDIVSTNVLLHEALLSFLK